MTRLLRQRRRLPTRGASVLAGLALFVLTGLVLVPNNMASEIGAELPWPDLGSFEPAVAEAIPV